jgi:hypothetical protein
MTMNTFKINNLKKFRSSVIYLSALLFCAVVYAFLSTEITKVDVSDSVIVPENYENLLVMDVTIPPEGSFQKDTLLHNGQAGSSPGDILSPFSLIDWYSDHNGNETFDGNQISSDNEATISSQDNILDPNDSVKNTGLASLKSFKYSSGVYEQFIDGNHSNSYTSGETVIRTSTNNGEIRQGDVIRSGLADITSFPPYVSFTDSIQPALNPPKYQDGETIIIDTNPTGILSDADTILKPGNSGLTTFPTDTAYVDTDASGKYSTEKAIIIDKNNHGKLDGSDEIVKSGRANLKNFGTNELYSDSNGNDKFDPNELLVVDASNDMKVQPSEIKIPGFANLKTLSGAGSLFSDDNKDTAYSVNELIVKNIGISDVLESNDVIFKSGKADLKSFANGIEKFIDDNKNGVYDDGECIINDTGIIGIVESADIDKPGKALLLPFSGHNYLFTDANYDDKYTVEEAIFKDTDTNGFIDNGELVTSGNAPVKNFPTLMWFIDANGNNAYNSAEAIISSADNQLSTTDTIVVSGPAFLTALPQGVIKWAEVNSNDKYDDNELIISSIDDILSPGEIIKSGLCELKPFPEIYNDYLYSDDNNGDNYSSDELITASSDKKLDSSDSVIRQGKADLLPLSNTSTLYIDGNNNNTFDQDEAIVNNNPATGSVLLDFSDEILRSGSADINSFADGITYIDQNSDNHYQGDADGDVVWNISGDPMSANDPDIVADQDEVLLKESVSQNYHALDDGDTVMRPGMAKLTAFPDNIKYIDHYNLGEFSGGNANETIIQDENGVLESTDMVIVTGKVPLNDFVDEKFIDDNNDSNYTDGEASWRDSGSVPNKLDPDDEIVKPGRASLLSLSGYKYTNDGVNSDFTGTQAIISDKEPIGILSRNDIQVKPGIADVKNFSEDEKFVDCNGDGKYTDGEPIFNEPGSKKYVVNPGSLGIFSAKVRYIDSDNSGYYSVDGSLAKTDTEAIILDNGDKELNAGPLDGTGFDKVIVPGTAKIKPIGDLASKLDSVESQINAFIDRNSDNELSDFEVLITDNQPTGILDPTDIVWGMVITVVNLPDGDHYLWSVAEKLIPIDGSTLNPPSSTINAYIDSYNFGSLDDYEVLITDNPPLNILDINDVVIGKIKNSSNLEWLKGLSDLLDFPWQQIMKEFTQDERFLASNPNQTYEGQPIINNSKGIASGRWDDDDLLVYDGTPPRSISNNWGDMRYIDDIHNGIYSHSSVTGVGDCILDYSLATPEHDIVYTDIIVTEGKAGFGDFQTGLKFCDQSPNNGIYNIDETLVNDVNNNDMIDQGEIVSSGTVVDNKLTLPLRYIDANHDGKFNGNEAIINDSGNNLLDVGKLDSTGTDKVVSSGEADLTSFNRAEKFVDGNNNSSFDVGEAIIYDWYDPATFAGEFILAGNHLDKNGSLSYLSPGTRNRDCVIIPSEPGKAGIVEMKNGKQKYIDYHSLSSILPSDGSYNGFYDIDCEPIIWSENNQLDKGKLDGNGTDTLIASGYCLRSWDNDWTWTDSNHDNAYQDNEAIVFDALGDAMIKSIGTGADDDRIIVSGDANLKDFSDMKYIDANGNNEVDFGTELTAKDADHDNKLTNEKIIEAGVIPFLMPFTSTDYRYCDWNRDNNYNPSQESIVYTPVNPDILNTEDEIVASGIYPALSAFNPQLNFLDNNNNDSYDNNEAIISGDGDQVFSESDQIIIHGIASSFDGTNIKYAVINTSEPYANGALIADTKDDILESNEVLTPGTANLADFDINDRYADSNHNGQYDYKVFNTGLGEAILTGTAGDMVETGKIKTDGYADLRSFDTIYKYSDSGTRDLQYNDGELFINDDNNDNKVSPSEIIYEGTADLKGFSANVKYCDTDQDGIYSGVEAIVSSEDDILHIADTVLAEGEANLHGFEQNSYRFTDSDYNGKYSTDEAIIVEFSWGIVDDILEDSDIVILEGTANIKQFPSNFKFLDDLNDTGEYENGEAIVNDSNSNNFLDPSDEIVTNGKASLKKFTTTEKYSDSGDGNNANNSIYDSDEAIIRDANTDGKLSSGTLDGTGTDAVLASGKAGLTHFSNNEKYVDANGNGQYDGSEDIFRDEDNNGIVTSDGDDQLVYFVVENIGTAINSDIAKVKLWADRDSDGKFEPNTDDAPYVKILISDTSNPKMWYEGPAIAPPLSAISSRTPIGYLIPSDGQRFFVTIDTGNNPTDGKNIQMSIPLNGVKTLYGSSGPDDKPVTNAYKQTIDHTNPNIASIISPLANDTIYGNIILRAEAGDSIQVGKVEFYDGLPDGVRQPIAVDEDGYPWEAEWDCSNAGFGGHTLYARVYDKTYQNPPKSKTINHYVNSQGVYVTVGIAQIIPLVAGWNYVSLSMDPFNTDVASLLSSIGTNARAIWAYDAVSSKWLRYDLDGPDFLNDLETVEAGIGYQILMTDSGTLKVAGTLPDTTILLHDGWNFVGCNSQISIDVEDALSSIIANHPSVWTINPANGEWLGYDPENPPNDLSTIDPGKAYWVHVTGNCVWNQ